MDKFEHKLRTTLHTRSVQSIMTRSNFFANFKREVKSSLQGKTDNITTYLRKFEIDKQNLNLAKRILQCESEHSRNKYAKQWKKTKRFLQVRSNFKKNLSAEQPKIYKFEPIVGRGKLLVEINFQQIISNMCLLSQKSQYVLKFNLGFSQIVPDKTFLTLECSKGYSSVFYAPIFLKKKIICCKLIKVSENNLYQSGKFTINLGVQEPQEAQITNKLGKVCGKAIFQVNTCIQKPQYTISHQNQHEKLMDQKVFTNLDHLNNSNLQNDPNERTFVKKKVKIQKSEVAQTQYL